IGGAEPRVLFLEMSPVEASSSLARRRLAAGEDTGALLAPAVRGYIEDNGLYRAGEAARLAADKKAHDVVELDLRGVVGYTDWFLVCTGNTGRQAKAIQDGILEGLKQEHGLSPRRVEGSADGGWILMDYLDVVVHIFTPQAREFYRLEHLWGEAPARAAGSG